MPRQMAAASLLVLQALAAGYRYGFDIMDATGLASGTVYPILTRLERQGLARGTWEEQRTAIREKRPARKYYRITAAGAVAMEAALARLNALGRVKGRRDPSPARA